MKLPGTLFDRVLWLIWVAEFGILEGFGVAGGHGATSLTRLTVALVPWWMLALFITWLVYHFGTRYWKKFKGESQ